MAKISNFGMHTAYLLGFEKIADVRGISSVVSLFENRMILSGIYLQIRPDRHVYIGKTSNIIRRFETSLAKRCCNGRVGIYADASKIFR